MKKLIAFVTGIFLMVGLGWGQSRVSSLVENIHRNADLLFARGCPQGEVTVTSSGKVVRVTHLLCVIEDTRTSRRNHLVFRIKFEHVLENAPQQGEVTAAVDAAWWAGGGISKFQNVSPMELDLFLQQLLFSSDSTFFIYVIPVSKLRSTIPVGLWFVFSPAAGGIQSFKDFITSVSLCLLAPHLQGGEIPQYKLQVNVEGKTAIITLPGVYPAEWGAIKKLPFNVGIFLLLHAAKRVNPQYLQALYSMTDAFLAGYFGAVELSVDRWKISLEPDLWEKLAAMPTEEAISQLVGWIAQVGRDSQQGAAPTSFLPTLRPAPPKPPTFIPPPTTTVQSPFPAQYPFNTYEFYTYTLPKWNDSIAYILSLFLAPRPFFTPDANAAEQRRVWRAFYRTLWENKGMFLLTDFIYFWSVELEWSKVYPNR